MNTRVGQITLAAIVIAAMLAGCGARQTAAPTQTPIPPTPVPSATARPTESPTPLPPTSTPRPTATPTPTDTPTPAPTATFTPPVVPTEYAAILEPERIIVPGGGFSFQPPLGYTVEVGKYQVKMTSPDTLTQIELSGSPNLAEMTLEDLVAAESEGTSETEVGMNIQVHDMYVAGEPAEQFELGMAGMITSTMVVALPFEAGQEFYGSAMHLLLGELLGFGGGASEEAGFDHHQALAAVLASLQFLPIPDSELLPAFDPAACEYTTDKTYGLNEDNPIILYQYPSYENERIDDYLQLLAGPDGESVERGGQEEDSGLSMELSFGESGTELVQAVNVTYPGLASPIKLYFQLLLPGTEDEIVQPPIPIGFQCKQP